ncbi:hypothetical protein Lesp02_84500 [Lentzea sp. NBRC 105346]|uniref:alpha/beta fold hydrolase n=1 Tax=Lentzea sp. NBRC 105346 TaxID=3032205 RepID=UPI0024A09CC6|nr:alpha/beta hydrolase [Lentzea sp. NBRC 105346]GLZ36263.1 hypothetical protein Lesp02_84500 [Lentzea sp. NBRC 105346]
MIVNSYGRGTPVTLVAHGLGATPGEARIPASGLPGTRKVITLPSHGEAPDAPPGYWNYPRIARDLASVDADHAVGVSLGAGALTRLVADQPNKFRKMALLLPAVLDQPREKWTLDQLMDLAQGPPDYLEARKTALLRLARAAEELPGQVVVDETSELAAVTAPVLIIAATGDPLHPEDVAKATAQAFPNSELLVLDSPAPLISHRAVIRKRLVDFFAG